MSITKCSREEALAMIAEHGNRPYEVCRGIIAEAPPKCCLFCQHCSSRIIDNRTGELLYIKCNEAPTNENDEWASIGMTGECLSFAEERSGD